MLKKLFLHEKTVDIMLKILEAEENGRDVYPLIIAKEVNSPYSYISKVLSEFEKFAIIESELKGRVRVVKFTEGGRRLAQMLRELKKELEKDFISRKKLSILKDLLKSKTKDFRYLAPIIAEIELLKKSNDLEVIKEAKELEEKVNKILGEIYEDNRDS